MSEKEVLLEAIKTLSRQLEYSGYKWLLGGSGSLLLHGLDVTPKDIDLVAGPEDYEAVKEAIKEFVTGEAVPHGSTQQTPFEVNGIKGELLAHDIDPSQLTKIDLDGVQVSVYRLEVEYQFYKARVTTDEAKKEANSKKIKMMEEVLGI